MLTQLDPSSFQMKTLGIWRDSDYVTQSELAWGPGTCMLWPLSAGVDTLGSLQGQKCLQAQSEPKLTDRTGF